MNRKNKKRTGIRKSLFEVIVALFQKRKFKKISASEFLIMIKTKKEITIIDCRDKEDFAENHIEGAINVPYQNFMKNWQKEPKAYTVITICYLGIYGRAAAQKIARSGNHTVYTVIGGMEAVNKLNL